MAGDSVRARHAIERRGTSPPWRSSGELLPTTSEQRAQNVEFIMYDELLDNVKNLVK